MDVEALELALRRRVAQPLERRPRQGRAAVALVHVAVLWPDHNLIGRSPCPQLGKLAGHRIAARLPVARDPCVQRCYDPTHAQRSSVWVERRRLQGYADRGLQVAEVGGVGSAPGARMPRPGTAPPSASPRRRCGSATREAFRAAPCARSLARPGALAFGLAGAPARNPAPYSALS